jgi:hypothetical protein
MALNGGFYVHATCLAHTLLSLGYTHFGTVQRTTPGKQRISPDQGVTMQIPLFSKSPLAKEISFMLIIKALVLYGIWHVFFSHPAIPSMIEGMDATEVSAAIVGTARAELNSNANPSSGEAR